MPCVPAPSCRKALSDATAKWPQRNRASDGICGDASHQARKSDHNSGNAFDLTHDPRNGPDCHLLSREVIKDSRVKYVIFAGHIFRTYKTSIGWAKYVGENPHNHHMHVSIKADARNDLSPWPWSNPTEVSRPILRRGDSGQKVRLLQEKLSIPVDGQFGPATEKALRAFQKRHGLIVDGIAGQKVWAALELK